MSAPSATVGNSGTGNFTQTGGTNSLNSFLYLGYDAGGSGTYSLGGSGQLSTVYEYVGYWGTGSVTQTGGLNNLGPAGNLTVGELAGSSGTYNQTGGQILTEQEFVGDHGTGTFTQNGGTNSVIQSMTLGFRVGSSGTGSLGGSGLLTLGSLAVGVSGAGLFAQSGGTNNMSNSLLSAILRAATASTT